MEGLRSKSEWASSAIFRDSAQTDMRVMGFNACGTSSRCRSSMIRRVGSAKDQIMRRSSKASFGNNTKASSLSGLGCEPLICKVSGLVTAVVHLSSTLDIFFMVLPRSTRWSGRDRADEFFGLTGLDRCLRGMFV